MKKNCHKSLKGPEHKYLGRFGKGEILSRGHNTSKVFDLGGAIENPDGSYSTERTVTVSHGPGYINVPTLDTQSKVSMTIPRAVETALKKNPDLPIYPTIEEAEEAAEKRSRRGGAFSEDR